MARLWPRRVTHARGSCAVAAPAMRRGDKWRRRCIVAAAGTMNAGGTLGAGACTCDSLLPLECANSPSCRQRGYWCRRRRPWLGPPCPLRASYALSPALHSVTPALWTRHFRLPPVHGRHRRRMAASAALTPPPALALGTAICAGPQQRGRLPSTATVVMMIAAALCCLVQVQALPTRPTTMMALNGASSCE